jgi:hypothetical protein
MEGVCDCAKTALSFREQATKRLRSRLLHLAGIAQIFAYLVSESVRKVWMSRGACHFAAKWGSKVAGQLECRRASRRMKEKRLFAAPFQGRRGWGIRASTCQRLRVALSRTLRLRSSASGRAEAAWRRGGFYDSAPIALKCMELVPVGVWPARRSAFSRRGSCEGGDRILDQVSALIGQRYLSWGEFSKLCQSAPSKLDASRHRI